MKLRVRGDSMRLRLTRGEVERLAAGEAVTDALRFGGGVALETCVVTGDVAAPGARMDVAGGGATVTVTVTLPADATRRWAASDEEGIEATQPHDAGALRIVVQKDFACLAPRAGDDDVDTFPHPEAGRRTC